jgi:predicted anti-sigma-YlaC factor YlaD
VALQHRPTPEEAIPTPDDAPTPPPDCGALLAYFWDYLDGDCPSEIVAHIDTHVRACSPCRRFQQAQALFLQLLAELRARWVAPPSVHNRVRAALAAERLKGRSGLSH